MTYFASKIFGWINRLLPEVKQDWARDMRAEFDYIPKTLPRLLFGLGCLWAAFEIFIKTKLGLKRLGQALVALGLTAMSLGCVAMASGWNNPNLSIPLYGLCGLYGVIAILTWVDLEKMKRFTLSCGIVLSLIWGALHLSKWAQSLPDIIYLRSLSIEAAVIMVALYVTAIYISWIGELRNV